LLLAHTDTVAEGELNRWLHAPFEGILKDGRVFGRGAFDCKGGIATSIYSMKILNDIGHKQKAKFLGSVDEESGADSELGIKYVISQGLKAKGAVYTYGLTNPNSVTIGHRGLIRIWVTCYGESNHSGSKSWQQGEKGANALSAMVDFLKFIEDFKVSGSHEYFPGYGFVITPTMMSSGVGESIVPDFARVLLDIRTLPNQNNQSIIDSITKLAERQSKGKILFKIEVKNNIPGIITDPDTEIIKKAVNLSKEIYKIDKPNLQGSGPANEMYMLVSAGIPTIAGYGPVGGGFHSYNEYIEIESIKYSLEFLTKLTLSL
jgi:acetylornithine deacetylase/succinyl-diaminopimelate desuccinylase-like protein